MKDRRKFRFANNEMHESIPPAIVKAGKNRTELKRHSVLAGLLTLIKQPRYADRTVFFCLILTALVVIKWRWVWLEEDPLWLDELHSWWVIRDGFNDVLPRAAAGNQSPGYFCLAWILKQLVYLPKYSLRMISAACGGILLVVTGQFIWNRTRSAAALLTGVACVTFSASQMFYSTEGRPYELLCLTGTIHAIQFVSLLELRARMTWSFARMLGSGLLGCLGIMIHPCFLFLLVAEMAVLAAFSILGVFRRAGPDPKLVSNAFVALGIMLILPVLAFLVYVPWIAPATTNRSLWLSVASTDLTLSSVFREAFVAMILVVWLGITVFKNGGRSIQQINPGNLPAGTEPGPPTQVFGQSGFLSDVMPAGRLFSMSSVLLSVFLTTGFGLCLATWLNFAPLALPRYQMAAAGLPFLAAGLAAGGIRNRVWRRLAATAMIAFLFLVPVPDRIMATGSYSTASGFGWNGQRFSLTRSNLRNEPWDQVWEKVRGFGPVFLLANILEDQLREPGLPVGLDRRKIHQGISLDDYLRFPSAISDDPHMDWRVVPCRTLTRPRFSAREIRMLADAGFSLGPDGRSIDTGRSWRVWLIVRGHPETAEDASDELLKLVGKLKGADGVVQTTQEWIGDLFLLRVDLLGPTY